MEKQCENRSICAKCKGLCCKSSSCTFSPLDFSDLTFEGLKAEIQQKGYIDVRKTKEGKFYLCVKERKRWPYCSLISKNGCMLKYENRPMEGRMLIPVKDVIVFIQIWKVKIPIIIQNGKCISKYPFEKALQDWAEYSLTLEKLYNFFNERSA